MDVCTLKTNVGPMLSTPERPIALAKNSKSDQGFNHDVLGRLLIPIEFIDEYDHDSNAWVSFHIRSNYRWWISVSGRVSGMDGENTLSHPIDYPRFYTKTPAVTTPRTYTMGCCVENICWRYVINFVCSLFSWDRSPSSVYLFPLDPQTRTISIYRWGVPWGHSTSRVLRCQWLFMWQFRYGRFYRWMSRDWFCDRHTSPFCQLNNGVKPSTNLDTRSLRKYSLNYARWTKSGLSPCLNGETSELFWIACTMGW